MHSYLPWTVVFSVLEKNLFNKLAAGATLHYLLCFSCLMRNKQEDLAEKKKQQLDKKITDYLLYLLWLALQAHKNMAQLIRTLSDYILIMVGFASDTLWVDKKSSLHVNLKAYLWEVWRERWCSWWRNTDLLHRLREIKTKQPSQYWIGW